MTATSEKKPAGIARAGIVFGTVLAVLVQSLDATIAAVALPHMQGSLSASQDEINWVITSYIVATAILTAPTGWLANRYGRKRVLIVAIAGFTAASVLTGFAQTLDQAVLFRFLQGAFGAPLVPLTQSLLLDTFETRDGMKAISWWSIGGTVGPILGPNLGGWITQNWDWRWVFFINVPIGMLCLMFLGVFVKETSRTRGAFDWFGFAVLSLFICAFQLMLDRGSGQGWFGSTEILVEACLAGLGLYLFVVHSLTTTKPFIDFGTLRDWNFSFGLIYTFMNSLMAISSMVLLSSFLQNVVGDPVGLSGVLMAPRAFGSAAVVILMGRFGRHFDPRALAIGGLLVASYEMFRMVGWTQDVSSTEIAVNMFVQGVGSSIAFVAMQTLTFSGTAPARRNGAVTVYGLARNMGQSIGVSAIMALLVRNVQVNHAGLAAQATPFRLPLGSGAAAHFWSPHALATRTALDLEVNRQATLIAYLDDFLLMALTAALIVPFIFLLRHGRPAAAE